MSIPCSQESPANGPGNCTVLKQPIPCHGEKLKCSNPGQLLSSAVSPCGIFPAAMQRGHQESHKIYCNREASGTVPGSELEGWIWDSPSWAAIKLLSVITGDTFPTGHQLGAVLQVTGRAEHPGVPLKSTGAPHAHGSPRLKPSVCRLPIQISWRGRL